MKKTFTRWSKLYFAVVALTIGFGGLVYANPVPVPAPEPATLTFLGTGIAGVGAYWILKSRKGK